MIVTKLAAGVKKSEIAASLRVHETTLYKWLRDDPDIAKEVEELEELAYQKCKDELFGVAFAEVEVTSASKMRALERLLDHYEEKIRRRAGEINQDDVTMSIMHICQVLITMPEAKEKVLDAYRQSRGSDHSGELGPGGVPRKLPDDRDPGA